MKRYIPPAQRRKIKITSLFKVSTLLFVFVCISTMYILLSSFDFLGNKPVQAEVQRQRKKNSITDQIVASLANGQALSSVSLAKLPEVIQNLPLDHHWPIRGKITTYFSSFHPAIDIADPFGTPVYAFSSGVIKVATRGGSFGNYIVVAHSGGFETTYAHLSQILVKPGDQVSNSTVIGLVGSTGNSTGPHLHFQVTQFGRYVNPLSVLN
jgi:murein DD-endopeptidase MepM/ murein hydrolase activator NlpD